MCSGVFQCMGQLCVTFPVRFGTVEVVVGVNMLFGGGNMALLYFRRKSSHNDSRRPQEDVVRLFSGRNYID